MLLKSSCIWLIAVALGASCTQLSGFPPSATDAGIPPAAEQTSRADVPKLIDDFVAEYRASNPWLSGAELERVLDTAERARAVLTGAEPDKAKRSPAPPSPELPFVPLHRRRLANNATISEARALVHKAQKEADAQNRERFDNPRTNVYWSSLSPEVALRRRAEDATKFAVNETIAIAAAIVAEADHARASREEYPPLPDDILQLKQKMFTMGPDSNAETNIHKRAGSSFWMENISHTGKVPFGGPENDGYKVFRNVKDYGAVGDGKTDDTEAINRAMSEQNRCGGSAECGASTVKPAIVYFPSGTYLISTPITSYYNTQMIGNANARPIIKAARSFVGLGVISVDEYTGGNGGAEQWYINQNNFLRQLRNFIVDVREAEMDNIAGVHWQVAQATSIQSVTFYQNGAADKHHMGIFAENGSGGFMSDLIFIDGHIGIQCGNQQFTSINMIFSGCRTAIDMLWDWGWTWKGLLIGSTEYGIKMKNQYLGGSIMLMDTTIIGPKTGIYVDSPVGGTESEKFTITMDNVNIINVGTTIEHKTAGVSLAGGTRLIQSWVVGKVYDEKSPRGRYQSEPLSPHHPTSGPLMASAGNYYWRGKPQYADYDVGQFINAKDFSALGNGVTDDFFQLQLAVALSAATNRPLYIPFGSYIVQSTLTIPVGAVIVGECWAQIVANGGFFGDEGSPQALVRVGQPGQKGKIEIQDLMFTTKGPTPGAVLMEWNVAQSSQGSVAMWDSHFRIGGAKGTGLTAQDCPKLTGQVNPKCIAGSMLLHMTPSSSGYLENVWAWVADHDFDSGKQQTQIDIYVARGILIQSQGGPVWLYGTASEHCIMYQYLLHGAKNVFMGNIQTESPYFFPKPLAPAPFANQVGYYPGDPDFKECPDSEPNCKAAWGLMIMGSTDIRIHGAGLYNWFDDYTQGCLATQSCQKRVVKIEASGQIWLYNLYTIGTTEMLNHKGSEAILSKANINANEHPYTAIINAWLMASSGEGSLSDVEPEDDDMELVFDEYISGSPLPMCRGKYNTLDDIKNEKSRIPDHCIDKYLFDVQLNVLRQALGDYDNTVRNGYKEKFDIYRRAIGQQLFEVMRQYMSGAQSSGNFRCSEKRSMICCRKCQTAYCTADPSLCDWSNDCKAGEKKDFTVDCPRGIWSPGSKPSTEPTPRETTYTLINEEGFYKDMIERGILKEMITWGDRLAYIGNGCQYAGEEVNDCIRKTGIYWHNFPNMDLSKFPDPAETVRKSYDNTKRLYDQAVLAGELAYWQPYVASYTDLLDTVSLPAMLMAESVKSMRDIAAKAEQMQEEERKFNIVMFVSSLLMLIPGAGQAVGAIGGGAIRAALMMIGEAGNVALAIYELVEDPSSALFTIMGFFLGGGVSRQPFREAAAVRRTMANRDIDSLPPRIKTDVGRINEIRNVCMR